MVRLLFVEDDPFISEIYTKKFALSGFDAVPALTGRDALKKIREDNFDLVLLDMVIPELSGMDVLRELRTNREYNPELKVIIFSNLSGPQERQEALAAGANGFISKTDFTPSEVVTEVKRYLSQFASQDKYSQPRAVVDSPETGVPSPDGTQKREGEKRILLIEDEGVFSDMFGKALREAGFDVVVEQDGQIGLAKAKTGRFDLVITDYMLPSLTGSEIIAALRGDVQAQRLPIFLLTASLDETEALAMETSGKADRCVSKTKVTPSELGELVREFFEGK